MRSQGEKRRIFTGTTLFKTRKCEIVWTLFKTEDPENDTLTGGTSLYRKYTESAPPPTPQASDQDQVRKLRLARRQFYSPHMYSEPMRSCPSAICSCSSTFPSPRMSQCWHTPVPLQLFRWGCRQSTWCSWTVWASSDQQPPNEDE